MAQKALLITLLSLCFPFCSYGATYMRHYSVAEGLSLNTVMAITQDKSGFIWIGTKNGLNRFDGYHFDVFTHDKTENSLCNSMINALAVDDDGWLWIGTDKGACYLDPQTGQFHTIDIQTEAGRLTENFVEKIFTYNTKTYFVSGIGVFYYDKADRKMHNFCTERGINLSTQPKSIYCDKTGIYIGLLQQGIIKIDQKPSKQQQFKGNGLTITCISEYDSRHLIVGTAYHGVFLMDKQTGQYTPFAPEIMKDCSYVRGICHIANGQIWIATEKGIYIFQKDGHLKSHLQHRDFVANTLSDNAIYSVFADRDGGVWIGSYFGGVDYISQDGFIFDIYRPIPSGQWLTGHRIRSFAEDSIGGVWIATEDSGLNYWQPETDQFITYSSLSHTNIQCLSFYNGELWIGTFSKGIDVYNPHSKHKRHYSKANSKLDIDDIFALYADHDKRLWVGTPLGLYLYNPQTDSFSLIKQLQGRFVSDIIEQQNGVIWIATYNYGLIRYNHKRGLAKHYSSEQGSNKGLGSDRITSLYLVGDETLWIGTEGGGLSILDTATDNIRTIAKSEGLPSSVIYAITSYQDGNVWVSTNRGLAEIDPKMLSVVSTYGKKNGIDQLQFNYNAAILLSSGDMCFGSIDGFVKFNPQLSFNSSKSHKPLITSILINNRDENSAQNDYARYAEAVKKGSIVLQHDETSIKFFFSCLDYRHIGEGHYEYKLDGIDSDWNIANDYPTATYSHLSRGRYTFRARYVSQRNAADKAEETLFRVVVRPHPLTSYPALMAYLICLSAIVWYIRTILRRLHRQREAFRKKEEIYQSKLDFFENVVREIHRQDPNNSIDAKTSNSEMSRSDIDFVNRLTEYTCGHISNEEFNIDQLASEMNMSPSSLYRKIKSVTGDTPGQFIRVVRLKRAAELLTESDRLISDVAFMVGFSSASHFTKAFSAQFGMTPTEYQRLSAKRKK